MIRLAVCGVNELLCDEIARRVRSATLSLASVEGLSAAELSGFDAVAFVGPTSPDQTKVEQIVAAGKHVLLATQTILSMPDLETLVGRGISAGVHVVVRNPDQTLPSRRLIHDELRGSKLGQVGLIRVHRWESANASRAVDTTQLPVPLVRDLELVLWLTNQFPNLVYANERTLDSSNHTCGTIQVHLGFAAGGMALVDYADSLPAGDTYQSLSTICANGAMYADDHPNRQLIYRGGIAQAEPTEEGLLPLTALIQQFVDGISLVPRESQSGITRWLQVRLLADAVRRSLDSREAISLEGISDGQPK